MKEDLLDSLPAELDSLTVNKITFNTLPPEIIKQVFCNIDSQDLYDLMTVCSYWNSMIQDLLDIQKLQMTNERFTNAVNIFEKWKDQSNGSYKFSIYRAPYSVKNIISKAVIAKHVDDGVYELSEINFLETLEELAYYAQHGGAYCGGCEDVNGSVWRTISAMTEYSVNELMGKSLTDETVQSSMMRYKWFKFTSYYMMQIAWDVGFIILYPDNKTFSVLFATDTGLAVEYW